MPRVTYISQDEKATTLDIAVGTSVMQVRDLPCLCIRGHAGADLADGSRRGRDARRHGERAQAQQPPLLPAHRDARDGRARRPPAGDADLSEAGAVGWVE